MHAPDACFHEALQPVAGDVDHPRVVIGLLRAILRILEIFSDFVSSRQVEFRFPIRLEILWISSASGGQLEFVVSHGFDMASEDTRCADAGQSQRASEASWQDE